MQYLVLILFCKGSFCPIRCLRMVFGDGVDGSRHYNCPDSYVVKFDKILVLKNCCNVDKIFCTAILGACLILKSCILLLLGYLKW